MLPAHCPPAGPSALRNPHSVQKQTTLARKKNVRVERMHIHTLPVAPVADTGLPAPCPAAADAAAPSPSCCFARGELRGGGCCLADGLGDDSDERCGGRAGP